MSDNIKGIKVLSQIITSDEYRELVYQILDEENIHIEDLEYREQLLKFWVENLDGDVSLRNFALVTCYSQDHCSRLFKHKTGRYYHEVRLAIKVGLAAELLKKALSLKEISELLGFSTKEYFSKVFKKYRGVSPAFYRRCC